MRTIPPAILTILLTLLSAQAQDKNKYEYPSAQSAPNNELEPLVEKLRITPYSPVQFENTARAPVTIVVAMVKAVKCDWPSLPGSLIRQYATEEKVTLVNNTDRRITAVTLQFTDIDKAEVIALSDNLTIEPYGSAVFGEHRKSERQSLWDFEYSRLAPHELTLRVSEIRFVDGVIWSVAPPPAKQLEVDNEPRLISKPQPKYTEQALRNKIQGPMRMWLLVGSNGRVKEVEIIRGLPDGLNEEAMREAYNLKFQPATKDGRTVEYWLMFEINYYLRQASLNR